ncbi:hypothetical protein FGRMN_6458 [Fusarium graminum]|nr:hypothetical protein FGRMN_6458 [Fusarium graminum]
MSQDFRLSSDQNHEVFMCQLNSRVILLSLGPASHVLCHPKDPVGKAEFIERKVKAKYERILHPLITYLGDAFKYRSTDGKFNSAMHPQRGQAGTPYALTVPSKTHPLGALPGLADVFDRLMARGDLGPDGTCRPSTSGLSSMLIYHATIIIHNIFRTNDTDKNISDSSSSLDLSPLYGVTDEMQRKIRDHNYNLGLLKPDTFAGDRLFRHRIIDKDDHEVQVDKMLKNIDPKGILKEFLKAHASGPGQARRGPFPDCSIDEAYAESFMKQFFEKDANWDPKKLDLPHFMQQMGMAQAKAKLEKPFEPCQAWFARRIIKSFAIPIITRYVTDFIYQHLNNCQVFFSYNTNETKLLKRRKDSRNFRNFLLKLAEEGNVREAGRWRTTRWIQNVFGTIASLGQDKLSFMTALRFLVADEIIKRESNTAKAAGFLLLTAFDSVYNVVCALRSSLAEAFSEFHPKRLAATALVAMIKVLAQLKNLRRKISIDSSSVWKKVDDAKQITSLTSEWGEMVPRLTTWKLRFDGYGIPNYAKNDWEALKFFKIPDSIQPFYQPNGPSHIGGSFTTPVCVCHRS